MKKIFLILFVLMIFFSTNIGSYHQAKASGFSYADIPGYFDEMYAGVVTGAMTVTAAGAHAQQFMADNVTKVYEGAKNAYQTLAPEIKQNFMDSINVAGDRIVVAGDLITHALDSLKSDTVLNPLPTLPDETMNNVASRRYNQTFLINEGYIITANGVSLPSEFSFRFTGSYDSEKGEMTVCIGNIVCGPYQELTRANIDSLMDMFNSITTFAQAVSFASRFALTITATYDGKPLIDESIYSQLDKRLRETDLPSGQLDNLRIPQTRAYTPTGQALAVGEAGLTLDGLPYQGDILWRQTTDAGLVLPLPNLTIDGVPVYNLDGVLIDSMGNVIPQTDIGNITVTAPQIQYIDDIPYVITPTGVMINVLTGEIVGEADLPIEGDLPTESGWTSLWEWLKKILNAILNLPAKIIDLLKTLLIALFIPTENFWDNNINQLKSLFWQKEIDDMISEFGNMDTSGGMFEDIRVSLLGVSNLEVVDADSINSILDKIHSWVRGVFFPMLLLFNINSIYKLIRGTDLTNFTRKYEKEGVINMLIELFLTPIFGLIAKGFEIIRLDSIDLPTWLGDTLELVGIAMMFFPVDVWVIIIANIALWLTIQFSWAIFEWLYKKVPGVN